jgi:hypothetical protein
MEIPRIVETLHCVEILPPHRVFYFCAKKSFHDNQPPHAGSQAGTGRTVPGSIALPSTFPVPRRWPGAVALSRAGPPGAEAWGD